VENLKEKTLREIEGGKIMKLKKRFVTRGLVLLSLILAIGCSSGGSQTTGSSNSQSSGSDSSSGSSSKPAIKVGVLIPKTGKGKDWGEKQEIAINIALKEINESGGINGSPLELLIHDTGGKNEEAVTLTRELIDQDVAAIAGPYFSGECEVAFPIANKAKVPIISSSSAKPGVAEKSRPYAFRNSMTDDKLLNVAVPLFSKHYGVTKFAVLYDEKDAISKANGTVTFPDILQKNNFPIVNEGQPITFQTGNTDFSAIVTKLKGLKPEAIVFSGLYQEALNFAKEMKRQGLSLPVIGGSGLYSAALLDLGGGDVNDFVAPTNFNPNTDKAHVKEFIKKFEPEAAKLTPNNTTPDPFITSAYDTIQVIAKSLRDAGLDGNASTEDLREAIRKGWEGLKDYEGVTGTFSINEVGDGIKQVYVMKAKDGKYVEMK
jgi:branched-chain amino acid transport system substrate-binding protein